MAHRLTSPLQEPSRVGQFDAARKCECYVARKYADVTDAIRDHSFRRAVEEDNLRPHLEDVLVARRQLLMDDRPNAQRQRLDMRVVTIEKREQLGRRFRHAALTKGGTSAFT